MIGMCYSYQFFESMDSQLMRPPLEEEESCSRMQSRRTTVFWLYFIGCLLEFCIFQDIISYYYLGARKGGQRREEVEPLTSEGHNLSPAFRGIMWKRV